MHVNREAEESLRTGSTLFLSGVKRVDGEFAAGSVVELVDVRHPERLIGRGSVALPSSLLRLLRALSPQQVACAISILLRLRYASTAAAADAGQGWRLPSSIQTSTRTAGNWPTAPHGPARKRSPSLRPSPRIGSRELADSLLLAQPGLCTTFLLDRGFLHGQVPTEPGGTPGGPQHPRGAPRVAGRLPG